MGTSGSRRILVRPHPPADGPAVTRSGITGLSEFFGRARWRSGADRDQGCQNRFLSDRDPRFGRLFRQTCLFDQPCGTGLGHTRLVSGGVTLTDFLALPEKPHNLTLRLMVHFNISFSAPPSIWASAHVRSEHIEQRAASVLTTRISQIEARECEIVLTLGQRDLTARELHLTWTAIGPGKEAA